MSTYGESGAGNAAPVCPRHPDRVSFVRCQRCGRPACPDCQHTAPVGIQCIDCVKEGNQAVRAKRTSVGARVASGPPVVTYAIIGIAVVVTLLQQVIPGLTAKLMYVPMLTWHEPWRLLTSIVAHGGIWHVALNGYALYIVGPTLERIFGRARYLALFLLSALGGSAAVLLLASPDERSWITGVVGASGAVFGLFAALALTMKRLKRSDSQILVLIGINLVLGFVVPGISWQAHVGGLVVGGLLAAAYLYAPKKSRPVVAWVAPLVLLAVLGAVMFLAA